MALRKNLPQGDAPSVGLKPLNISSEAQGNADVVDPVPKWPTDPHVNIDLSEVYFLIVHFLSAGPCQQTCGQLWNELLEHQLLPRRYHGLYSRSGQRSGYENDDGTSFPLSYSELLERYPHVENDHLVQLLRQLLINKIPRPGFVKDYKVPNAAHVPTILGTGPFSLLCDDGDNRRVREKHRTPPHMRWPHMRAGQVHGLSLREIGGGFPKHHRPPSIRAACYAIAKPSMVVQRMEITNRLRGHRNAVYCATYDRSGRYVFTGADDRLVKIWSMETAFCLASCRGHEGDITDLAVSFNNIVVASASNDCVIRVWRVPDGSPISVLRGHTAAVTAIAFCPRPGGLHQLLSSSDDGTCRIWDARVAQVNPRIFVPAPVVNSGKMDGASTSGGPQSQHQIFCCAFNSSGTVFVTGSSDHRARVWNACKPTSEDPNQPSHEMDVLAGHENDVNYVQFSGCAISSRVSLTDGLKDESVPKFRNLRFSHENILTCSRDGSATIFSPRSRRSHGKARWVKQFHLKVPPPPMPPQPPRGPRQRILPTPRGVNMIIWSLDNRFVLAAIMDCRICVWNAANGEVVHKLMGHTASTYVLDVHPLNPRIAMSAGYDGKAIVWDIWEGKSIRIYEVSPYKLVDGKFSPDGTSIILSDDVGQLHFLSTGQGESQKDAQYDQFFLGDYRPLIQDSFGHVLDQETQLTPYQRNMQDLLCDSGMIPYEEPYQSMYQSRRLGALGIEWKPSSLKLAAGPDFSLDPEYQLMPLADLDFIVEPLPEFVDAMDWEPEVEVRSDDTDSEYNVIDGYSSAAEHGSLEFCSSDDPESSAEDSEVKEKDGSRRSKRKKQKCEIGATTSSGRRVKRRNLDGSDGTPLKGNRSNNLRIGRRGFKRKSSKSKASRPRRAAARNALNLFSKITETATDDEEEDDGSESDLSETESSHSYVESDDMDESVQNERHRHLKGKEIAAEKSQSMINATELPNSHTNNRKRLVVKLPVRNNSNSKIRIGQSTLNKDDNGVDNAGSSFKACQPESDENGAPSGFQLQGYAREESHSPSEDEGRHLNMQDLSKWFQNGDIKWGCSQARSSKRQRFREGTTSTSYSKSTLCLKDLKESVGQLKEELLSEIDHPSMVYNLEVKHNADMADEVAMEDAIEDVECVHDKSDIKDDVVSAAKGVQGLNGDTYSDQPPNLHQVTDQNDDENAMKGDTTPVSTRLRIKATNINKDSLEKQTCDVLPHNTMEKRMEMNEHDMSNGHHPVSQPNGITRSNSNPKRRYTMVYTRSKLSRANANSARDADGRESTSSSSARNQDISGKEPLSEAMTSQAGGSHSMNFLVSACGHEAPQNGSSASQEGAEIVSQELTEIADEFVNTRNNLERSRRQPREQWGSSSRTTVGLRPRRNRRTSNSSRESSPVDQKKSHQQCEGGSWFMLPAHEEGSRYIPQLGDEVAYLRQGHQEYLEFKGLKEAGPWKSVKGSVRAVEFCKIVKLEYATLAGSGDRCCKLTLQFVDPTSSVLKKSFKLTLPEVTDFPDFLVERSRYDAAMQKSWCCRDKCRVWWESEGEGKGGWWEGRIRSIEPKSSEFPDSPWERYSLSYKSDPKENHKHSPWELFDDNVENWSVQSRINAATRDKLLAVLVRLEESGTKSQDPYGVQHLRKVSQKQDFINSVPVPLSLDIIHSRVKNWYYRSVDAVRNDIEVMLSNAQTYANSSQFSAKMKRLSELLEQTIQSL